MTKRAWPAVAATTCAWMPQAAYAHAFDDRYDLPLPLAYFTAGAALTVAFTFVVAVLVAKQPDTATTTVRTFSIGPPLRCLARVAQSASLLLFLAAVIAGFAGTADPMMNLAPTLIWIVGWIGLSVASIVFGDVWSVIDPSRTLCSAIKFAFGTPVGSRTGAASWHWLESADAWPSVALLLAWCWIEVVNPHGATPEHLAWLALAWLALNTTALLAFGESRWRRTGDMFALYFGILGRFAPMAASKRRGTLSLRPYGTGLERTHPASTAIAGFIVAMLSTVLFDGLLSGETWRSLRRGVAKILGVNADGAALWLDTSGLFLLWVAMFGAYALASAIAARSSRKRTTEVMSIFALALVPIAAGYHIAHNLSILLVQGQQILPLLSDPLGRQWNLFGTAGYRANIGIVDARFTWYVAIGAIVGGHVIAVWLGHKAALRTFASRHDAIIASLPLTLLMIAYTAMSLMVIAEPMVKFGIFEENAATQTRGRTSFRGSDHARELLERVAVLGRAPTADCEGPRDFAHVEIVLRIERQSVRRGEAAGRGAFGCSPAREQCALGIENRKPRVPHLGDRPEAVRGIPFVPCKFGDVDIALRIEREMRRTLRVRPLFEKLPVRTEDLDAVDLSVAHEHAAVGRTGDAVGQSKLARTIPRLAPRSDQLARGRKDVDARVPVAVGDVDLPLRADGDVGRAIERRAATLDRSGRLAVIARIGGHVQRAHRHEQSAFGGELAHRVIAVVGGEDGAVGGDIDAVRAQGEFALAPGALVVALAVVDDHRILAPAHQVHAIFAVHRHTRDIPVRKPLGQLLPAFDDVVFDLIRHERLRIDRMKERKPQRSQA